MVAPRTTGGGNRGLPTRHHYAGGLLASSKSGSEDQYYHQDRLGSVANLSGGDATASDDYKYDPFGGVRAQPAPSATDNRFSFTGQQRDESTGLYYYGARFYDSSIGRFLTQDTWAGAGAEPQSLNKYLYAYSNPGKFTDPTGHAPEGFPPDFGPPDVRDRGDGHARPADGTWTITRHDDRTQYEYESPPCRGESRCGDDRYERRIEWDPKKRPVSPRNLHRGYTITNEDLNRWYGPSRPRESYEDPTGFRPTLQDPIIGMPEPPVESTGDKAWGFTKGFGLGAATGVATAAFIGFTGPIGWVAVIGYGAYSLAADDWAGAKALGRAFDNFADPNRSATAQDWEILGGILGGVASGGFAKPAAGLGTAARQGAVARVRPLFRPPPPPLEMAPPAAPRAPPWSIEELWDRKVIVSAETEARLGSPPKVEGPLNAVAGSEGQAAATAGGRPRLPQNGMWDGVPGESNFTPTKQSRLPHPDDLDVVDLAPGESVPFRNGRPDFSKWALDEFDVAGLTGQRAGSGIRDSARMELAVAERYSLVGPSGRPTAAMGRAYLDRLGLVPHHAGGTRVQLLAHGLHGRTRLRPGIPHAGGATDLRNP